MGMLTMNNVGASVDHLVGKSNTPRFGFREILVAPMNSNNEPINLRFGVFNLIKYFRLIKIGVGNKIITQETDFDTLNIFN